MKEAGTLKKIYGLLVLVAFSMMVVGYSICGEVWYDAVYYALQAFFVEYTPTEVGNAFLNIGRFVCPLLTVTGFLVVLRDGLKNVRDMLVSNMENATAVYYDTDQMRELGRAFDHPVLMGDKFNKQADTHVLLFDKDVDNLTYYKRIESKLKPGSKVYICLEEVDSKLLDMSDIYFFNVNEIIARNYWKERNLQAYLQDGRMEVKVAILGFGALGQKLLDYGLYNNIYSLSQSIQYHVWGESTLYRSLMEDYDKMNEDTVTFHERDWWEEIALFKEFDRIIVAEPINVDFLQALLYMKCAAEVDYYNPDGADLGELYKGDRFTGFGVLRDILNEETIKTDELYREAKKVNYDYLVKNDKENTGIYTWERADVEEVMEEQWKELDGFSKGSNVACADYHQIRLLVMESMNMDIDTISEEDMEMLTEMEHIRWSRYHYVNHWSYGAPEDMPLEQDGQRKVKDMDTKRHSMLIPYAELPESERKKDRDVILELFGK